MSEQRSINNPNLGDIKNFPPLKVASKHTILFSQYTVVCQVHIADQEATRRSLSCCLVTLVMKKMVMRENDHQSWWPSRSAQYEYEHYLLTNHDYAYATGGSTCARSNTLLHGISNRCHLCKLAACNRVCESPAARPPGLRQNHLAVRVEVDSSHQLIHINKHPKSNRVTVRRC